METHTTAKSEGYKPRHQSQNPAHSKAPALAKAVHQRPKHTPNLFSAGSLVFDHLLGHHSACTLYPDQIQAAGGCPLLLITSIPGSGELT